jgi:transcriptional regulator with XRE-family HTH domain
MTSMFVGRLGSRDRGSLLLLGLPSECYAEPMPPPRKRETPPAGKTDPWKSLGEFIRSQRGLANLSLRQLSEVARVSNPYLSQVERGIYKPSAEILKSIADALNISAETLFAKAGLFEEHETQEPLDVEAAVRMDSRLTSEQKKTLLEVYRNFVRPS